LPYQSERTPTFNFQMEYTVSNLIFEFLARSLVINVNTSLSYSIPYLAPFLRYFIKVVDLAAKW